MSNERFVSLNQTGDAALPNEGRKPSELNSPLATGNPAERRTNKKIRTALALATAVSSDTAVRVFALEDWQEAQPNYQNASNFLDSDEHKPCVETSFNPDTIVNDGNDYAVFEAAVAEACRPGLVKVETNFLNIRLTLDNKSPIRGAIPVTLRDDGAGEDKQAGDWKFTSAKIRYDTRPLKSTLRPKEDIDGLWEMKPFIPDYDALRLHYVDGSVKTVNTPSLLVLDQKIPRAAIFKHTDNIQTTDHIINMRDDNLVVARRLKFLDPQQDLRLLTRQLYGLTPNEDPYHFLSITSSHDLALTPPGGLGGTVDWIRRDMEGTGMPSYYNTDIAQLFGSQGKLRLNSYIIEPKSAFAEFHEWLHWAGAYYKKQLKLNDEATAHWKPNTSIDGILGGSRIIDNGDGTYTVAQRSTNKIAKIEQALMGWITASDVPDILVALNENQDFSPGKKVIGDVIKVPMSEVTATYGVRTPGPNEALRNFQVGYVYTTKDRLSTDAEITARDLMAKRYQELWYQATDGQSTLEYVAPKKASSRTLEILEAAAGKTLENLNPTLKFKASEETTAVHIQLIPAKSPFTKKPDGPGVDLLISDKEIIAKGEFKVPPPVIGQGPYIILPGMGYSWRVRQTDVENPDVKSDVAWSQWKEDNFRTPDASTALIRLMGPTNNASIQSFKPQCRWENQSPNIFYYEVQLSKDPNFNTDPKTATAPVYWAIIHGGETTPINSWTPPVDLAANSTYYWRARPRQQGDARELVWTPADTFKTPDATAQTSQKAEKLTTSGLAWDQIVKDHWQSVTDQIVNGLEKEITIIRNQSQPDIVFKDETSVTVIFNPQKERLKLTQ